MPPRLHKVPGSVTGVESKAASMSERHVVLVTGGRDYPHIDRVKHTLSALHSRKPITMVVCGGATGADSWAAQWARENGVQIRIVEPDWDTHGRKAGPMRNQGMLDIYDPDTALAFRGGRGTADMVRRLRRHRAAFLDVDTAWRFDAPK